MNRLTLIIFKFAHHFIFIFIIYNVIYDHKVALRYSLLIKLGMLKKTKELIRDIIYIQIITMATKIKKTNQYINVAKLILE